jgi:hypothetical protein
MRIILFCLILSIGGCSTVPTPTFNEESRVVSCYVGDEPITVVMRYEARSVFDLASARYNRTSKHREIRISNEIFNHNIAVVEFAAYHECAHHQLDHVDMAALPQPRFFWSDKIMQEEQDADCFAAKAYIKNNGMFEAGKMYVELQRSRLLDSERLIRINDCLKE